MMSSPKIRYQNYRSSQQESPYGDLKINRSVKIRTPVWYACTGGDVKVEVQPVDINEQQNPRQLAATTALISLVG